MREHATLETLGEARPVGLRDTSWGTWSAMPAGRKLGWAVAGLRSWIAETWGRGGLGRAWAILLAPLGVAYALGSVLRDSIVYRAGWGPVRRPVERGAYLRHRFGGTQQLVHWREQQIAVRLCRRVSRPATVLDAPAGYGRFTPVLAERAGLVVSADIDRPRLRALRAAAPRAAMVQADLQGALPFKTGAFDLVFHVRYLQHAHAGGERERALAELARVTRQHIVVSYYRRGTLHGLVHAFQAMARPHRRRQPAMIPAGEFARLVRGSGCRIVSDQGVLPGLHAQRLALLEKIEPDPGPSSDAR